MATKRRPEVQLTKDNCDDELVDEAEAFDKPQVASQDVLRNRSIVKAKRRLGESAISDGNGEVNSTGLFSGLDKVFGSGKNTFGTTTFGGSTSFGTSFTGFPSFGDKSATTITIVPSKSDNSGSDNNGHTNSNTNHNTGDKTDSDNDLFNANLTKLNQTFYEHIKKYMDSSMLYDFTVVCNEYTTQYDKIKKLKKEKSEIIEVKQEKITNDGSFKFGAKPAESSTTFKLPQTSAFGQTPLSFGSSSQSKLQFGFGTKPNLFGSNILTSTPLVPKFNVPAPTNVENKPDASEGAEEDTPPKVVSVEHSEDDSVYSTKCKLFYLKDGSYIDKGLGFLYIKTQANSKAQLLIRSDTATGNILLNIALVASLPVKKADKRSIMLTCVPNPEIEPKKKDEQENGAKQTVTFLIRVKPTDCDDVYNKIVEYQSN